MNSCQSPVIICVTQRRHQVSRCGLQHEPPPGNRERTKNKTKIQPRQAHKHAWNMAPSELINVVNRSASISPANHTTPVTAYRYLRAGAWKKGHVGTCNATLATAAAAAAAAALGQKEGGEREWAKPTHMSTASSPKNAKYSGKDPTKPNTRRRVMLTELSRRTEGQAIATSTTESFCSTPRPAAAPPIPPSSSSSPPSSQPTTQDHTVHHRARIQPQEEERHNRARWDYIPHAPRQSCQSQTTTRQSR